MMILDNLALFLRIVEKGGLAAAGRELGLSAASVSERLVALEKYYGAALLHRTTRAISLTDEGRLLVEGARRLLAEADELEAQIRLGVDKISGPIRLSAPIDLGRSHIVSILDAFLAQHPEVAIDLNLTDGYVDLVGQGQDFAIRYGELADSTLRVKRLVESRRIVCAFPAYLETRGTPQHPDDLIHHECLVMRYGLTTDRDWPFRIDGKERRVLVRGHRIANDGELVRVWCRNGFGIARKSRLDVAADLREGALVELLQDFSSGDTGLQIVYPATQAQPRRVRLLIERIAEAFCRQTFGLYDRLSRAARLLHGSSCMKEQFDDTVARVGGRAADLKTLAALHYWTLACCI
jgi:DNA-binding transcriptional LysR family regulator